MTIDSNGHEHEFEPQHGLHERLPANERILWQGSPDPATLAIEAFHLRAVALYFVALMVWRAATAWSDGGPLSALESLIGPALLSATALGLLGTLAWLTARTAVYTLTDKRVVMRIGVVLTLTFNLPLRVVESAAVRRRRDAGDAIVIVGHDLGRLAALADTVTLLSHGRVVGQGSVETTLSPGALTQAYGVPVASSCVDGRTVFWSEG